MIDPYDPPHPDGPVDPRDDFSPLSVIPWLDDPAGDEDWDDRWSPEDKR